MSGQGFKPTTLWELADYSAAAWLNRRWFNFPRQKLQSQLRRLQVLKHNTHFQMELLPLDEVCEVDTSSVQVQELSLCDGLKTCTSHFKTQNLYFLNIYIYIYIYLFSWKFSLTGGRRRWITQLHTVIQHISDHSGEKTFEISLKESDKQEAWLQFYGLWTHTLLF